jgi:hypothetical protein
MARLQERKWDLGVGEAGVSLEWSWWCDIEDIERWRPTENMRMGEWENGGVDWVRGSLLGMCWS